MDQLSFTESGFETVEGNPESRPQPPVGAPRFKAIDRHQVEWRSFAIEDLIEENHSARAVWSFLELVDLTPFEQGVRAVEGRAGQSGFSPMLLAALWLYGYSRGIGSARELSRCCEYEPGCRWLCGDSAVNYHSLSDFRVKHEEALHKLLVDALGVLSAQGLIKMERVAHDGSKVRAVASPGSYHREKTLEEHLAEAEAQVQALEAEDEDSGSSERQQAAQQRSAQQRRERLQQAHEQLEEIRKSKKTAEEKAAVRVSETEPEARIMKMPDKSFVPAYNLQVSTDAEAGIIVNADLSTQGSDFGQLVPALEQIQQNFGKMPDQVLTDGGFMSRETILALDGRTDLIGSYDEGQKQSEGQRQRRGIAEEFAAKIFVFDSERNEFVCPAGKTLPKQRSHVSNGKTDHYYRAAEKDCENCPHKAQCCPQTTARTIVRIEEHEAVARFRRKMETAECKQRYKERSRIAEFPFCWIKEKFGFRRFHVRGLAKARMELWWVTLAYNIQQWMRMQAMPKLAVG
jgi:transposase